MVGHVGHTLCLAADDLARLRVDMTERHILARRFCTDQLVVDYSDFDFAAQVRRLLVAKGFVDHCDDLRKLHVQLRMSPEQMSLGDDELNAVSRAFYETDNEFIEFYHDFLRDEVVHELGCNIYFQATPTFRFHFPFEQGFDWKPRYHTDIMLGHPPAEVNIWVPITPAFGTNTMRIMNRDDSKMVVEACDFDFDAIAYDVQYNTFVQRFCHVVSRPVELEPYAMLFFNPLCLHATQFNETDNTRVSMDFRVIPVNAYDRLRKHYKGTGRRQMDFSPGSYYDRNPL